MLLIFLLLVVLSLPSLLSLKYPIALSNKEFEDICKNSGSNLLNPKPELNVFSPLLSEVVFLADDVDRSNLECARIFFNYTLDPDSKWSILHKDSSDWTLEEMVEKMQKFILLKSYDKMDDAMNWVGSAEKQILDKGLSLFFENVFDFKSNIDNDKFKQCTLMLWKDKDVLHEFLDFYELIAKYSFEGSALATSKTPFLYDLMSTGSCLMSFSIVRDNLEKLKDKLQFSETSKDPSKINENITEFMWRVIISNDFKMIVFDYANLLTSQAIGNNGNFSKDDVLLTLTLPSFAEKLADGDLFGMKETILRLAKVDVTRDEVRLISLNYYRANPTVCIQLSSLLVKIAREHATSAEIIDFIVTFIKLTHPLSKFMLKYKNKFSLRLNGIRQHLEKRNVSMINERAMNCIQLAIDLSANNVEFIEEVMKVVKELKTNELTALSVIDYGAQNKRIILIGVGISLAIIAVLASCALVKKRSAITLKKNE